MGLGFRKSMFLQSLRIKNHRPIKAQKQLVAEVEKEEEIVASNHRLIGLMEQKIEKVIKQM